jgi:Na+/melibiose symporter-like transporter
VTAPAGRLSFRTQVLYGLGSISFGAHIALYALLLFFYNQVVGLSPGVVSLALAVSLILDSVWDPLIGHISDNTRTRWGRRHPFLYGSAVPIGLTVYLLFNPPAGLSRESLALWLLAFVVFSRLLISLYEMPSAALAPELAPDYDNRTTLMSYRWVMLVVGTAVANGIGYFWFFRPTPQYPQGQLNPAAWGPLALACAVIMMISIVVSALGTHDRIPSLHKPPKRKVSFAESLKEVGETVTNRNLLIVLLNSFIGGLSFGIYLGLALYLYTYFWGLTAVQIGILTSLVNPLSSILSAFVAPGLSRLLGKRSACIWMCFIGLAVMQGPILLRLLGYFPGAGSPALMPLLIVTHLFQGIMINGGFIVASSMVADITEDAQAKTGRRSEGLLFSANTFVIKATTAVSALLPGVMLAIVHFPAKALASKVPPETVHNLVWIYLPITTTLSVLSISAWSLYRIDKDAHARNVAAIRQAEALADHAAESAPEAVAARLVS